MSDPDPRSAWSQTAAANNAGATSLAATQTAAANVQYAVTNVSASTDVAGNLTIKSIGSGSLMLYQMRLAANTPWRDTWETDAPLLGRTGEQVTANVDSGSLTVRVNVSGYGIANG